MLKKCQNIFSPLHMEKGRKRRKGECYHEYVINALTATVKLINNSKHGVSMNILKSPIVVVSMKI